MHKKRKTITSLPVQFSRFYQIQQVVESSTRTLVPGVIDMFVTSFIPVIFSSDTYLCPFCTSLMSC